MRRGARGKSSGEGELVKLVGDAVGDRHLLDGDVEDFVEALLEVVLDHRLLRLEELLRGELSYELGGHLLVLSVKA